MECDNVPNTRAGNNNCQSSSCNLAYIYIYSKLHLSSSLPIKSSLLDKHICFAPANFSPDNMFLHIISFVDRSKSYLQRKFLFHTDILLILWANKMMITLREVSNNRWMGWEENSRSSRELHQFTDDIWTSSLFDVARFFRLFTKRKRKELRKLPGHHVFFYNNILRKNFAQFVKMCSSIFPIISSCVPLEDRPRLQVNWRRRFF